MLSARNFNRVLATTVTLLLVLVGTARAAGLDLIPQKIDSGISPACVDSIAKASGATFQCNWDTTTESVGGHATEANAYDSSNNMSAFSAAVSFTTDDLPTWPAAPTDLTAVCNANNTQATLSWSGVNGATLYAVRVNYKANDGGPGCLDGWYCSDPPDKAVNNNSGTSYIAAVIPGQPYAFWVHGLKGTAFGDANSATFVCGATPSLTVASSSPNSGALITVSPNDNNNQGNGITQFSRTYNNDTIVTLTAASTAGGNNFNAWSGCDSAVGATCTVTLRADKTVTAFYGLPTWPTAPGNLTAVCDANNTQATLSWSGVNGATSYAVRVNYKANDGGPGCIDGWYCSDPPDKVVNNNPGTSYIAAVTPNQPYAFWVHGLKDSAFGDANSGIFVCGTGTPSLTVASSNPSIGASITVSPSDNNSQGNGVTQFTRTYNTNTAVTLIAAPIAGGNNFITWTGCDSTSGGGGTICNMAVTANKTVTAVYGACSITAIAMGTQVNGSLTDDDCAAPHRSTRKGDLYTFSGTAGQRVTISMVSSDFECYLMLIDPNGNVVTFDDNFPARISNFKLKTSGTYTIEATATGFAPGRGGYFLSLDPLPSLTVLSSNPSNGVLVVETPSDADGEFNGITQFTRFYANNTVVALTAPLTAGGNPFSMWNGCDNTTGTTCTVTMSADKTVTAVYVTPAAITLTYGQTLLDRVGQSNQTRGDGRLDPTFIVTFPTGGATRTVTSLRLDGTSNGGTWDTNGGTGFWTVGVARDLGSGLLNSADDSVNFTVAPGSSFVIFVSDWFLGAPFPNGLFRPGNEFKVTIGFSDNTIATAMAIITAQPVPSVVINDTSVIEGNTGMTNAVFTLNLSAASNQFVTVYYSTADGSATAGSDYVAISGVYTFQPGETSKAVTISVIGDTVVEADETFFVNLGVALNAVIARGQGTGTIINDDLGGSAVWAPVAPMNIRRTAHTATRLKDGRVLVAGGLTETAVVSSAEIYNPATNAWTQVGGMSTARGYHTANLLPDGRVLVAGGAATNTTSLSSAEIFNPATNSWTPATSMSTPRDDHTATLLSDGRVLVAGGENVQTGLPYTTLSSAEIYDPATNVWSPTPSMQFDRVAHADTLLSDSRVLVTGGLGTDSTRSEIYNPNTNNWSLAGAMTTGRIDHVAALLPNGTAIVTGGETDSGPTASVEAYNPFSRNWTSATPMSIGRSSLHTATLISNGGLLVTGGNIGGENSSSSAEIYNSDLNIWTNTVSMNAKRRFHAATLLLDGSVLVTGGQDGLTPLSSAEVFSTGQPVSPSISLRFDGVLRDRVGQGEFAQNADGQLDGVFNVSLNPGSGTRTITKLHLTNTPGGAWNTQGGDGFWTLGVATGFDAGLLNAANDAVNFLVPQGDSFKIFASDFQNLEYAKGTTFTLTVTFSDGTTATAAALIGN